LLSLSCCQPDQPDPNDGLGDGDPGGGATVAFEQANKEVRCLFRRRPEDIHRSVNDVLADGLAGLARNLLCELAQHALWPQR
jgi:hypothetical protein